jgi:eukaryotic-like serine/threonine-protein kinase
MRLEDLIGRRLGRYEVLEVLGRGGMAAVYRARDTVLRRDVALKILYPQFTGDTALVERFQREAVLAAGLDHPNILPIYDVGEAEGLVYIAMRLLEGRSFADVLRLRGALPLHELIPIVDQIAAALDYAHARQIVHRDIKPANILVEGSGTGGQESVDHSRTPHAVLTDFGIAKSLDPAATGLTVTGVLIGTPEYMAPEQIRGGHKVDGRADIYALAVLVYRALTGRRPFEGGTQEVLLGHLQGTFPDPSSLDAALPQALDAVLRRALARDPEQRYGRAGELARDLRSAAGMGAPRPAAFRAAGLAGSSASNGPAAGVARHEQPTIAASQIQGQPTAQGQVAPYARPAQASRPAARPVPPAYYPERPTRRGGGAALAIIGLLLVAAIGGGLLYTSGILSRGGGTGAIGPSATAAPTAADVALTTEPATAVPTALPEVTAAPTEQPAVAANPTEAPTPTARPTEAPSATTAPTNTPSPSNTPTHSPTPTETPTPTVDPLSQLTGGFRALYEQEPAIGERIGNPTEHESGGLSQISEQAFEGGSMFYFRPQERIYVLLGKNNGTWRRYEQETVKDFPVPTPADPPACAQPVGGGGFARIWGSESQVRETLGCPLAQGSDLIEGAYQPFERGAMLYSHDGLGRGKSLYVLYDDGTFEWYQDPNQ